METSRKIGRSFTRPLIKSSTIFPLAGCILLVIKLATAATFSWLWVFGTMFFPFWLIVGFILTVIALVLAAVCVVIAVGIVAVPVWFGLSMIQDWRRNRLLAALRAEMEKKLAARSPSNDLIDRR